MSDTEKNDIDIDSIVGNGKWRVTWNGKELLNMEKVVKSNTKLIALKLEELLNRDGKKCYRCGREEWLTIDHIVPVSILRDMGVEERETYADSENLRILCKPCNSFKANRLDFADPRTKRVLMRALERL
jgi:5-methylcytosine-specific restriction endonuclease McrA